MTYEQEYKSDMDIIFLLQSIQFVRDRSWLKYYVTGFDRYHIVHEVI